MFEQYVNLLEKAVAVLSGGKEEIGSLLTEVGIAMDRAYCTEGENSITTAKLSGLYNNVLQSV